MVPSLERAVGKDNVMMINKLTGSEDFSFYQKKIPGFFFFVGVTPKSDLKTAAANHSPRFYVDESALQVGLKAMLQVALDFLESP
jgi:amidohydrolase